MAVLKNHHFETAIGHADDIVRLGKELLKSINTGHENEGEQGVMVFQTPTAMLEQETDGALTRLASHVATVTEKLKGATDLLTERGQQPYIQGAVFAMHDVIDDFLKLRKGVKHIRSQAASIHADYEDQVEHANRNDEGKDIDFINSNFKGDTLKLAANFVSDGALRQPIEDLAKGLSAIATESGIPDQRLKRLAEKLNEKERGVE